ncbi:hypothetical protein GQ607_015744, partial [Colletotrichum asianum]
VPCKTLVILQGVVRKGKALGSLNRPWLVSDLQRQSTPWLISVSFLAAHHGPLRKSNHCQTKQTHPTWSASCLLHPSRLKHTGCTRLLLHAEHQEA